MFLIIKQSHIDGCIPACAASVMQYYQIPGNWTYNFIYDNMKLYPGTADFDKLKSFLRGNGLPEDWDIQTTGREIDFKQFIVAKNNSDIPLLCPIQGDNNSSHCIVLAHSDENNARVFDPDPNSGESDPYLVEYEVLKESWSGSFIWLEKI